MVDAKVLKLQMKKTILSVLKRDGTAQQKVIVSSLKLETGFSDKVVAELIHDMVNVGLIEITDGVMSMTKKGADMEKGE